MSLTNIPLGEALNYITSLANLRYQLEPYAVSIVPLGYATEVMVTKEYYVPPGFISGVPLAPRMDAKDFLAQSGVTFPPGAEAFYFPATSRLVVRNTRDNLALVDTLTSMAGPADKPHPDMAGQPGQAGVSGLLPMKLELPRVGQPYVFDGFYNAERVEFRYEDWWARARRLWFWFIGGGLLFLRFGRARPWWHTAWAVLVLSFAPLCLSESFTAICNALLGGWLVGLVLHRVSAKFVFAPRREEALA
ncbi:MAG: hypothetical protein M3463_22320 [Verrucomicrobiota bacterium]|nr:hypothetical protein [Verrucomicrobiota bacterium]